MLLAKHILHKVCSVFNTLTPSVLFTLGTSKLFLRTKFHCFVQIFNNEKFANHCLIKPPKAVRRYATYIDGEILQVTFTSQGFI